MKTTPSPSRWTRWKYLLNGFLIVAPFWFFYQAMTQTFPAEWPEQTIGPFTAAISPADDAPPYSHHGSYVKDFSVRFCTGCVDNIRVAYLHVGKQPAALADDLEGILHGGAVSQNAHAPYPLSLQPDDRLWLTVQEWNGAIHHTSWPL